MSHDNEKVCGDVKDKTLHVCPKHTHTYTHVAQSVELKTLSPSPFNTDNISSLMSSTGALEHRKYCGEKAESMGWAG